MPEGLLRVFLEVALDELGELVVVELVLEVGSEKELHVVGIEVELWQRLISAPKFEVEKRNREYGRACLQKTG